MHILMTVNATWNIWNFRRPVLRALLEDGHKVTILAPHDEAATDLAAMGARLLPLEMNVKGLNPLEDMRLLWRLRRIFAAERPDVILGYTIKNNIFGAMAARRYGIPFIPNVTGLGTAFLSGGTLQHVAESLYHRAFAGLDTVFFQNADDRALFLDRHLVEHAQARLLPGSGIDLAHFEAKPLPAPDTPPVFLMIARLLRDKGVLEYVEAARALRQTHPEARFHLLGALNSENRTAIGADTVRGWQDDGLIHYLGTAPDVRPHIARATCVVLPSYREGAPRTLIEAAAMARPLITTDVPGCRSVVEHARTGLLCAVRDGQSLADAYRTFLDMPQQDKIAMGQAGRIKMQDEYDEALVVAAYRAAIDRAAHVRFGATTTAKISPQTPPSDPPLHG